MPGSDNYQLKRRKRKRPVRRPAETVSSFRLRLVFSILVMGLLGLVSRMAWLQVFQTNDLQARARAFQIQRIQPLGARRSIVDRNGRLIALDEQHQEEVFRIVQQELGCRSKYNNPVSYR